MFDTYQEEFLKITMLVEETKLGSIGKTIYDWAQWAECVLRNSLGVQHQWKAEAVSNLVAAEACHSWLAAFTSMSILRQEWLLNDLWWAEV